MTDKINRQYYEPILSLCEEAIQDAIAITKNGDSQSPAKIYTNFCMNLLFSIKHDIAGRQNIMLPRMISLYEKEKTGHDCATCDGNCKVNRVDVNALSEANTVIVDSLCRLHKLAIPAYMFTQQIDAYKELRYKMLSLNTALLELFFIEESVLFTAVVGLQAHAA